RRFQGGCRQASVSDGTASEGSQSRAIQDDDVLCISPIWAAICLGKSQAEQTVKLILNRACRYDGASSTLSYPSHCLLHSPPPSLLLRWKSRSLFPLVYLALPIRLTVATLS